MTNQEFFNRLIRLEQEKKRRIQEIEDAFVGNKKKLFESYAKANSRFKPGDVIMLRHPDYGAVPFTIIRVKSMKTVNEGSSVYISYQGRELHTDFSETYSTSMEPRFNCIYDRNEKAVLLTGPLHVSYLVVTSAGREIPAKTCRESIETARRVLTSTDEDIVSYGITASGEREEIQRISNVNKYFKKH